MPAQKVELIVVAGPMKGERFPLPPDRPTRIGRSGRGVNLAMDEQLSLDHAEIYSQHDGFLIRDLASHSGTVVNGQRLGSEPQAIGVGTVIEVGQTVLRMQEASSPVRLVAMAAAALLPVALAFFGMVVFAGQDVGYAPTLEWVAPVNQRVRVSPTIPVPIEFVRDHGVDHRTIWLRKVTDGDGDGVHELWLRFSHRDWVIGFGQRGEWVILGEFPVDCIEQEGEVSPIGHRSVGEGVLTAPFPYLLCNGLVYQFRDEAYRPRGIEGVIAWARPWQVLNPDAARTPGAEIKYGPGPLQPYRMSLVYEDRLRGFLKARGVDQPVHYLICEEAVTGVRGQLLPAGGEPRLLDYGCLGGVQLNGSGWEEELGAAKPVAFAFTVSGHDALVDDITTYLSGGPSGLFLGDRDMPTWQAFSRAPSNRASLRVEFVGEPTAGHPVATEAELPGVRRLFRSGIAGRDLPAETVASIRSPGVAVLDLPGCSTLEVETRAWSCRLVGSCLPTRRFVRVTQKGCGRNQTLVESSYQGGWYKGGDADVDVALAVDVVGQRGRIDVLRTRVAYREKTGTGGSN